MRHSFILPREKRLMSVELKLIILFFGITFSLLFITSIFLSLKSYAHSSAVASMNTNRLELEAKMNTMQMQIEHIQQLRSDANSIMTNNAVLKQSLKNLFDLVPERITLSSAYLDKDSLILYGVTPNKEVYDFMLHAPLRSIFHRTYSSFYPLENGWYRFVSTNYLDSETLQ